MENNKLKIYLDFAATTPLDPEVFEVMKRYFSEKYGNASSIHQFGQESQEGIIKARHQVADFLGCQAEEIIFTSGATEGNNTVIKGIGGSKKLADTLGTKPHIIVSKIEHECIMASSERLEQLRFLAYRKFYFNPVRALKIFWRAPAKLPVFTNFLEVVRVALFKKVLYANG